MNKNEKELSEFVKQEINSLMPYENEEVNFPLGDYSFNFWNLSAESVFPNSSELQKTFNKMKKKKLRRNGTLFNLFKNHRK